MPRAAPSRNGGPYYPLPAIWDRKAIRRSRQTELMSYSVGAGTAPLFTFRRRVSPPANARGRTGRKSALRTVKTPAGERLINEAGTAACKRIGANPSPWSRDALSCVAAYPITLAEPIRRRSAVLASLAGGSSSGCQAVACRPLGRRESSPRTTAVLRLRASPSQMHAFPFPKRGYHFALCSVPVAGSPRPLDQLPLCLRRTASINRRSIPTRGCSGGSRMAYTSVDPYRVTSRLSKGNSPPRCLKS